MKDKVSHMAGAAALGLIEIISRVRGAWRRSEWLNLISLLFSILATAVLIAAIFAIAATAIAAASHLALIEVAK